MLSDEVASTSLGLSDAELLGMSEDSEVSSAIGLGVASEEVSEVDSVDVI